MPTCVQIVVLMALASLALKRPAFVEGIVTVLIQAADSLRDVGTLSFSIFVLFCEASG
jgi:hypothetical protein